MSEHPMVLQMRAREITKRIYAAYGSGTGVLFGIPSYCRKAVETIVKITLEMASEREVEE